MLMHNKIIWIEGCDGSGKSTLIKNLSGRLKFQTDYNIYQFHCPGSSRIPFLKKYPLSQLTYLSDNEFLRAHKFFVIDEYFKAWNDILSQIDEITTENNIIFIDRTPFISGIIYQFWNSICSKDGKEYVFSHLMQMKEIYYPSDIIFCNTSESVIRKNLKKTNQEQFLSFIDRYTKFFKENLWIQEYLQSEFHSFNYCSDEVPNLLEKIFNSNDREGTIVR